MKTTKKAWKCFRCLHFPAVSLLCFKAAVAVVVKFVPTQRLIPCVHLRFLFLSFSYDVLWRRLLLCCQLSNFPENIPWLNGATVPGVGTANDRQLAQEAGPFATVE